RAPTHGSPRGTATPPPAGQNAPSSAGGGNADGELTGREAARHAPSPAEQSDVARSAQAAPRTCFLPSRPRTGLRTESTRYPTQKPSNPAPTTASVPTARTMDRYPSPALPKSSARPAYDRSGQRCRLAWLTQHGI